MVLKIDVVDVKKFKCRVFCRQAPHPSADGDAVRVRVQQSPAAGFPSRSAAEPSTIQGALL